LALRNAEGKDATFRNYMHFAHYFCWAMKRLKFDPIKVARARAARGDPHAAAAVGTLVRPVYELLREYWGRYIARTAWLIGSAPGHVGASGSITDEQLGRILYARFIRGAEKCLDEDYVSMDLFRFGDREKFCRADAQDLGRVCNKKETWRPLRGGAGGDDGGGGGGIRDDNMVNETLEARLLALQLPSVQSLIEYSDLESLKARLPSVPTAAVEREGDRVAIGVALRGGRRRRVRRAHAQP
jgi:hypothetical protein